VVYIDSRSQAPMENVIELPVLEALAAQIALAVENSRLHAEERRKGDLMSILAHEIRNPLSGILGYSSMGESGRYQLGTDATEFFSRIRREGERLRRLVDNILELARHEAGKVDWSFDSFELTKLIDVAVESYGAVEGKDIKFVVETDGLSDKPYGNADRLTQVLVNLIGNAVKFTPEGGTITIRAFSERVLPSDPDAPPTPATDLVAWAPVDPGEADPRDFVRVDVADTGPGMSEAVRSRLFRKFSQGTGKRGGVGLGLYISREIISRHGGTIWVTSEPGKGATFSFRIPIAP